MSKPKILLFDIETSPNLAYIWGKYEQDAIAFEQEWELLSVAWKWLGEKQVHCAIRQGMKDDKQLCRILHDKLQQADVVIGHNVDDFDLKKSRARFAVHNLPPTKPIATVDTLKVARKYFKFNSNKLDDLGKTLGLGRKVKHSGYELWLKCMKDDAKAWEKMAKYNKQDVRLLEAVYLKLKPWMDKHPNLALLSGNKKGCPSCGSPNVAKWGLRPTAAGIQQRMCCLACGGYFMTKKEK